MKKRSGFVSNSSTSSYVCEICHVARSGWDASPWDLGFRQCANGHVFCDTHSLESDEYTPEEKKEHLLQHMYEWDEDRPVLEKLDGEKLRRWFDGDGADVWDEYFYDVGEPERICPICKFVEPSSVDMARYLLWLTKIPREEIFAIVKEKNHRRRKLYDYEYVAIVCEREGLDLVELMSGLKEKFGTYAKFKEATSEG